MLRIILMFYCELPLPIHMTSLRKFGHLCYLSQKHEIMTPRNLTRHLWNPCLRSLPEVDFINTVNALVIYTRRLRGIHASDVSLQLSR